MAGADEDDGMTERTDKDASSGPAADAMPHVDTVIHDARESSWQLPDSQPQAEQARAEPSPPAADARGHPPSSAVPSSSGAPVARAGGAPGAHPAPANAPPSH